jgi:hypothetical protein
MTHLEIQSLQGRTIIQKRDTYEWEANQQGVPWYPVITLKDILLEEVKELVQPWQYGYCGFWETPSMSYAMVASTIRHLPKITRKLHDAHEEEDASCMETQQVEIIKKEPVLTEAHLQMLWSLYDETCIYRANSPLCQEWKRQLEQGCSLGCPVSREYHIEQNNLECYLMKFTSGKHLVYFPTIEKVLIL